MFATVYGIVYQIKNTIKTRKIAVDSSLSWKNAIFSWTITNGVELDVISVYKKSVDKELIKLTKFAPKGK